MLKLCLMVLVACTVLSVGLLLILLENESGSEKIVSRHKPLHLLQFHTHGHSRIPHGQTYRMQRRRDYGLKSTSVKNKSVAAKPTANSVNKSVKVSQGQIQQGKVIEPEVAGGLWVASVSNGQIGQWTPPPNAGELGAGVAVDKRQLSEEQRQRLEAGQKQHAFNEFVSDLISLHRSLPPRLNEQECRSLKYRVDLPDVSVVIVFHNEAWSTLLRTVHSVLDRSPPHLLRKVILVDDFSDLGHLKKPLDDYLSGLTKVQLIRATSREGLIRARLLGLSYVTAPVVVFLDSHCECAEGWLEPLLARLAENRRCVVVPRINNINPLSFQYQQGSLEHISVGTFSWKLLFSWTAIQPHERIRRNSSTDPVRTPTMAGGLFAIDRDYFYKLGTYDPDLKIWGGENLELSFKVWMCGGTLEMIPCSNVGHVFRSRSLHSYSDNIAVNLARLAAVWLDDYVFYYHQKYPQRRHIDPGDVSGRQELRRRLKCHSFGWYMKNVLPERYLPADQRPRRPITNELLKLCIGRKGSLPKVPQLHLIINCNQTHHRNTLTGWSLDAEQKTVYYGNYCLDYDTLKNDVTLRHCDSGRGTQSWIYSSELKQLYHVKSTRCVEVAKDLELAEGLKLMMLPCNYDNPRQQWLWDTTPLPGPSWRKDMAAGIPVL